MNPPNPERMRLVYLIGTYPELTNTFIDREIATLRRLGLFEIMIVSIRHPHTLDSCSPEQKALYEETQYLLPARWARFNFLSFLAANIFFMFISPRVYFGTLVYLLSRSKANAKSWMMTTLYFLQGVLAANLLRKTEFDHLHVHFMDRAVLVALVVARFLKKTYSFTAHAADIYTGVALVREKIENAHFMITVSQYNKQHLLDSYPGIDADKIRILHPWVDGSQFTPSGTRPTHDRLHILSVGRLVEKKGHIDLIDAACLLKEKGVAAECKIVGEGPLRAAFEARIAQRHLQDCVQLLGGRPQAQVLDLLREWADIFVLPCVIAINGDRDGIPVSLAEAMAMELPVVSTDIIGIGELVQPGTGILVAPHDPIALAEALFTLACQEKSANARMGRKGREVVNSEFDLFKGTQALAGYFHQAVGRDLPEELREEIYDSN